VKGKKTSILKSVDKAAKVAGKLPLKTDRGFRSGKVGKSKIKGGSSSLYPASGGSATIHVYRSQRIGKIHHSVTFDVFDQSRGEFTNKASAYASEVIISCLHRHHCYLVRFNSEPNYPQIVEILGESPCDELTAASVDPGPTEDI
jgi:hypothetical protein